MGINITHFGSLVAATGGPAYSTYLTMKGIQLYGKQYGMQCRIIIPAFMAGQKMIASDVPIQYADHNNLGNQLQENHAAVYHIQGLWSPMAHRIAVFSKRNRIPYIVTLRGMLYPHALAIKKWKKHVALWLYQAKDLRNAACIQATCEEERAFYRDMGFRNPVAIIPNAVELSEILAPPQRTADSIFRIGYLGRLHPRKKVERILYALASPEMKDVNAEFVVIGKDDPAYEDYLKNETQRLGLKNVTFAGFLHGKEKTDAIRSLSVLVVPSDFENFGNIVVEALKEGVPVIASRGMPWQDLETYHCGWWVPNSVESLAVTLKEASSLSKERLFEMGENGQRLLRDKYEFESVSKKMVALYQWILQGGTCPDFVEVLDA